MFGRISVLPVTGFIYLGYFYYTLKVGQIVFSAFLMVLFTAAVFLRGRGRLVKSFHDSMVKVEAKADVLDKLSTMEVLLFNGYKYNMYSRDINHHMRQLLLKRELQKEKEKEREIEKQEEDMSVYALGEDGVVVVVNETPDHDGLNPLHESKSKGRVRYGAEVEMSPAPRPGLQKQATVRDYSIMAVSGGASVDPHPPVDGQRSRTRDVRRLTDRNKSDGLEGMPVDVDVDDEEDAFEREEAQTPRNDFSSAPSARPGLTSAVERPSPAAAAQSASRRNPGNDSDDES